MNHFRLARGSNRVVRRWPRTQRAMSRLHARLYVATGGRFISRWFSGAPILVLETVGRCTGESHSAPLLYLSRGAALMVMAANAGADRTPAWWLNLRDADVATVTVGRSRIQVRPRVIKDAERDDAWREFVAMYPQAQYYGRFTSRAYPLVALESTG